MKVVGYAKTGYAVCVFPNSADRFSVNTLANPVKMGAIICIEFLGPSRAKPASRSLRRVLLTPQVNPVSLYRYGKRT